MIRSFKPGLTETVWAGRSSKGFPADLVKRTRVKLAMIHSAETLTDLLILPANRLEALKGTRHGQHSIRINGQWRICFK